MTIHEAAQLVKGGIFVRRIGWPREKYLGLDHLGLFIAMRNSKVQMHFSLSIDDITASDWESFFVTGTGGKLRLK